MPFTDGQHGHCSVHETATRAEAVRRLAGLKDCVAIDELPQALWPTPTYLVPAETIVGLDYAESLGLRGENDLFGGVVPHAFVATKAITHPLVAPMAEAPQGWSNAFPELVADVVLPGFSVFSRRDADEATTRLLALGPLRIKLVAETGGRGQEVASSVDEVHAFLARVDDDTLRTHGVVLEHNLSAVDTLSVGQVRIGDTVASYFGHQYLTKNNKGTVAYGGSALTVVSGDFSALLATLAPGPLRTGVEQAMVYDSAARASFAGFFASRINYDIAQGQNAAGEWCSGVLEQSWRMGGATPAELTALEAMRANPGLTLVRTRCVERFGPLEPVPAGAVVYFQGEDPDAGPLTKYAMVETDGHAA